MLERIANEIREKVGIKVYCGDTVGNFLLAASTDGKNVEYDKSRIPPPAHRETYTDASGPNHPIYRAIVKAKELGDAPIIMESLVSRKAPYALKSSKWGYGFIEIPAGIKLQVKSVWVPKSDEWRLVDFIREPVVLEELFMRENPVFLLK